MVYISRDSIISNLYGQVTEFVGAIEDLIPDANCDYAGWNPRRDLDAGRMIAAMLERELRVIGFPVTIHWCQCRE